MTNDEEKRARIIAAQAAREAALPPIRYGKRRSNWAASPPVAPPGRRGFKPAVSTATSDSAAPMAPDKAAEKPADPPASKTAHKTSSRPSRS